MFTGIVEATARVDELRESDNLTRLRISHPVLADLAIGDSIAVNGVCLTAVAVEGGSASVEAVPETMSRTNLGELKSGDRVNIERPLAVSARFDGHIVQGHVDGRAKVASISDDGDSIRVRFAAPSNLMRYVVEKGSIAVDGVSLTVSAVTDDGFEVVLIPHTLEVTALGDRAAGDSVNLEIDVVAKYVERLMEGHR